MLFNRDKELVDMLKMARINRRDVANYLQVRPGTLNAQINGFSPLAGETRKKIIELCQTRLAEIQGQGGGYAA